MTSPLLKLPDDLWDHLSHHLTPSSIFSLLQTNTTLHTRLRPLLPSLSPNLPITQHNLHNAILEALQNDHHLFYFLLHLCPVFTTIPHPLITAFHNTALAETLPPTVIARLVQHFLQQNCIEQLFQILENTTSIAVLLTVTTLPLISTLQTPLIAQLIHSKALLGESKSARRLLSAHPYTASTSVPRKSCVCCASRHTLLHIAAEVGDECLVQETVQVLRDDEYRLLNARDCAGETPLGVAIRRRKSRVAQLLVRAGADVRQLVGCAARGGAVDAGEVWFKPVVDVD